MKQVLQIWRSRWLAFIHDILWIFMAIYFVFAARFDFGSIPITYEPVVIKMLSVMVPVQIIFYWYFGLYRGIWRFASFPDLKRIVQAVLVASLASYFILFLLHRLEGMPRSILILYPFVLVMGLAGDRLIYRWLKDRKVSLASQQGKRALIIGAGQAAEILVRDMLQSNVYLPIGYLDDDPKKLSMDIRGIRVLGSLSQLPQVVTQYQIEEVLFAIPTGSNELLRQVVKSCAEVHVPCRTVPSLSELSQPDVNHLRSIRLEDLLGRDEISLDDNSVRRFIAGKKVLVTGAGGSIGSELCRQLISYQPKSLILLDHAEYNLYQIDQELSKNEHYPITKAILGDIRDHERMEWVFKSFGPEIVFNAAAYKHVPLVEENPAEGIKTNVLGTCMIADLAAENHCKYFVQVSTDKAVNPTNVMGATKRMAEIYCQNLNGRVDTSFITTRFGNVLGSAGSVVPLFRKQIEEGGPVTVTHKEITRFFMTIPEAVSLILQAATIGSGGEIFVLDMGEPVKIRDMAEQMIRLAGYTPEKDIKIIYTGLRSGEKLFEELFHKSEVLQGTTHPKIMLSSARKVDWDTIQGRLQLIRQACAERDVQRLVQLLQELVPEFTPDNHFIN